MPTGIYKRTDKHKEAHKKPLKDRFWSKVEKTDYCWNWTAHKDNKGYGRIEINGKNCYAHRISWEMHYGKIPEGLFVCHHCDNPLCINPKHLFLGTQKDNIRDAIKKGRMNHLINNNNVNPSKGEKHYRAKLTENQVREIRKINSAGYIPQRTLAGLFGISPQTLSFIVNNKTWKHI